MKTKILYILIILVAAFSLTGCGSNNDATVSNTTNDIQVESSTDESDDLVSTDNNKSSTKTDLISDKEFQDDFELLVSKNIYPKYAYSFYMDFYKSVSKDVASTCMVTLIEHLEKNKIVVKNDFVTNGLQDDITKSSIVGNSNILKQSSESDYYLLYRGVVIDNGFDSVNNVGIVDIVIDYDKLLKCSDNLNVDIIDYLKLAKDESLNPITNNESLIVGYDVLSERISNTDVFLTKYPKTEVYDKAYSLLYKYTDAYLKGDKYNTPFDASSKILNENLKKSYEDYIDSHKATKYQKFLRSYYTILSSNGFKSIINYDYEVYLDELYLDIGN